MSIVKKSLVAVTIVVAVAGNAHAAGLTNYNTQQSFEYGSPPAFSWGGAYVGVHGGVASPKFNPLASGRGLTGVFRPGITSSSVRAWSVRNSKVPISGTRRVCRTVVCGSVSGARPR